MAKVHVVSSELVFPAQETPGGSIWLSNLDLAGSGGYTPTVHFFRPNGDVPGFFAADGMKNSLAKALVAFYPLAGRLGLDGAGRVQVNCTGEGVVFVTARSEHYTLEDLMDEFVPCGAMRDLLVPATPAPDPPCPLLLVQVTRLRCGGVVLGSATHHSMLDGRSIAHFFQTWASISRGGPPTVPPCFDHTPLAARPAPRAAVLYDHREYKPEPEPADSVSAFPYASAIITMTEAQVGALKARCAGSSTFRAVVALVWQCVCRARALPAAAETRLYSMVDMRARLQPPLPPGYLGNAVVRTSVSATVEEVVSRPVVHVAQLAHEATSQGDDYARSLIDYLKGAGVDTVNQPPRSGIISFSRAHLRVISWMGIPFNDADFGWGAPAFMAPAINCSGFAYVMNVPGKDGALALVLSLEPESMPEFSKVFAHELARLEVQ